MSHIVGLFKRFGDADKAVRTLLRAGFNREQISIIARDSVIRTHAGQQEGSDLTAEDKPKPVDVAEEAGLGAIVGGGAGGLLGILAGLGAIAIPGIGPVIAAGTLGATLGLGVGGAAFGAAVGGILGAITSLSIPKEDAEVYAEGVRRGGILVGVEAEGARRETAAAILADAGALDIEQVRQEFEEGGWEGYDKEDRPDVEEPPIWLRDER